MKHVEFISYSGSYPNLCRGVLTLKIDGKIEKFGHESSSYDWKTNSYRGEEENPNHESFWSSGGRVWFDSDWGEHVDSGRWYIDETEIPEQFRKYYDEIDAVFNENVPHGCCGGCV